MYGLLAFLIVISVILLALVILSYSLIWHIIDGREGFLVLFIVFGVSFAAAIAAAIGVTLVVVS